jgi:hypothetical protein
MFTTLRTIIGAVMIRNAGGRTFDVERTLGVLGTPAITPIEDLY